MNCIMRCPITAPCDVFLVNCCQYLATLSVVYTIAQCTVTYIVPYYTFYLQSIPPSIKIYKFVKWTIDFTTF